MDEDTKNFDALRKLLALKRHEQPPPGYFDQLSSEVMARLRSGEHHQTDLWKELGEEASWLQRLWGAFYARPALAGAFGVAMCGVLITGIYYSQNTETETAVISPTLVENIKMPLSPGALALSQSDKQLSAASSTNPVSLFDRIGVSGQMEPVSFNPAGK